MVVKVGGGDGGGGGGGGGNSRKIVRTDAIIHLRLAVKTRKMEERIAILCRRGLMC